MTDSTNERCGGKGWVWAVRDPDQPWTRYKDKNHSILNPCPDCEDPPEQPITHQEAVPELRDALLAFVRYVLCIKGDDYCICKDGKACLICAAVGLLDQTKDL